MSTPSPHAPARLAPALNAACQCIWLDRDRLRSQLHRELATWTDAFKGGQGVEFAMPVDASGVDFWVEGRLGGRYRPAVAEPRKQRLHDGERDREPAQEGVQQEHDADVDRHPRQVEEGKDAIACEELAHDQQVGKRTAGPSGRVHLAG